MISIVDLGLSNLGSLISSLSKINVETKVVSKPEELRESESIILPGVGAFTDGMRSLKNQNLINTLKNQVNKGVPILGICLGMQLLSENSEEFGICEGLGLIKGNVLKLPEVKNLRIPNMGWCDLFNNFDSAINRNINDEDSFYFVHSYHLVCSDKLSQSSYINFGNHKITAIVEKNNIFGVQFHPEKSHDKGLKILSNFAEISKVVR